MPLEHLSFRATLDQYRQQAAELAQGVRDGDPQALQIVHHNFQPFLDSKIAWLPRDIPDSEIQNTPFDSEDAQLTLARWYSFQDWPALAEYFAAVTEDDSPVQRFESAVEAVITGDAAALQRLLATDPNLIRARSTRITHFDPPRHRATLLHYVAANGVEGYRSKTPANAVEVSKILLDAGAEPDALADMYGRQCTTMSMLVSSAHPANAGLQEALVETLVDHGAALEEQGSGPWRSPLMTALTSGYIGAAEVLVKRGARVDNLAAAAGLGRVDDAQRLLNRADPETRHRALALAAQHGRTAIVKLLLDAGEDPDRYNPRGHHAHSTPLHQSVLAGHADTVNLLLDHGARLDQKDTIYQGTPLDWAIHGRQTAIENELRQRGAQTARNLSLSA